MSNTTGDESPGALPGLPEDWPSRATETVVNAVATIRAKTADPATRVGRYLVYGFLLSVLLVMLVVVFTIVGVRFVNNYMPGSVKSWATHLVFAVFFTAIGLVLWAQRPTVRAE